MTDTLTLEPIGVVHSPFKERKDAPRQATVAGDVIGTVELHAGRGFEDALEDVTSWDYLWLVVWFHHNQGWRPKVQPPRSAEKRGLFATRSPYRPNPIGLSAVKLLGVSGLTLTVQGLDLLDGTPLLDLKPYVPYCDSMPDAGHGWLEVEASSVTAGGERAKDPIPAYLVELSAQAHQQLAYLQQHGVQLEAEIRASLALGPTPHAYRRIRREGDLHTLALKDWRVVFTVEGPRITVERLRTGYKPRDLATAPLAHRAFAAAYP